MPIFINPPASEPFSDTTEETKLLRKNTHWFILADPTTLALVPVVTTVLPSGGTSVVDGPARASQTFRLIPTSITDRPRRSGSVLGDTATGQQRRYDFTLLGEWDAVMDVGDSWEDERGERWIVVEKVPHNGYETRGLVTAYGKTR